MSLRSFSSGHMTTPHPRDMGHTVYSWQSNCWGVGWGWAGARSIQSDIVLPLDPPHPISCQVLLFHLQIILQYALFSHSYTSALLQPCPESLRQSSPWSPGCGSCPLLSTLPIAARDILETQLSSCLSPPTLDDSLVYYLCPTGKLSSVTEGLCPYSEPGAERGT